MDKLSKYERRMFLRLKASLGYFKLHILEKDEYKRICEYYHKKKPLKRKSKHKKKYYEYLRSKEWNEIRIEMLTAYPKCNRCDSSYSLQVHHKTYKNVFKEEPEDLEVLCKNCHKLEHKIK